MKQILLRINISLFKCVEYIGLFDIHICLLLWMPCIVVGFCSSIDELPYNVTMMQKSYYYRMYRAYYWRFMEVGVRVARGQYYRAIVDIFIYSLYYYTMDLSICIVILAPKTLISLLYNNHMKMMFFSIIKKYYYLRE